MAVLAKAPFRRAFRRDFVRIPDSPALESQPARRLGLGPRHRLAGTYRYIVGKGAKDCDSSSYGLFTSCNGDRHRRRFAHLRQPLPVDKYWSALSLLFPKPLR